MGSGEHPPFCNSVSRGFVAQIICAMSKAKLKLAGLASVDDMDLIANDTSNEVNKVSEQMQQSLSTWHGLLQATGGELVPEKCFWYLIDFKWNNNKWQYKCVHELPGQLLVKQYPNGHITIPRLEPNKARWTLGVNQDKAHHLQGLAVEWASHMARASLSCTEAEFSL